MSKELTLSGLDKKRFQSTVDGKKTDLYVLKNRKGLELCVTNYGATIVSLMSPDKNGVLGDMILGHDSIEGYITCPCKFLGSVCGRVANRISKAKFNLDEVEYQLSPNQGNNLLHGGAGGFHTKVWEADQLDEYSVAMTYISPDGEEGFPGTLNVAVVYTLTDDNEVEIRYSAQTDRDTIVNLTNHATFNLSGDPESSITDHTMAIYADFYVPANSELIPTGELLKVEGTAVDLRTPLLVSENIDSEFDALRVGAGYDLSYVLRKEYFGQLSLAAELRHPESGRSMRMFTTEPCVQFYSGNFIGQVKGKHGKNYAKRTGLCLEAQHLVDSCNIPHFPSIILREDEDYSQTTIYQFGA